MPLSQRPNVLILYTDQQRWDALGVNDPEGVVQTPNLDRMAAQSTSFQRCYVQNAVCMPSRMSMLTSQYPSSLGIGCNGIPLPEDTLTVNKLFGLAGYRTANIGKLHFLPHANRDHREPHPDYGFDHLVLSDEPGCYADAYLAWVARQNPEAVPMVNCGLPPARAQWESQMNWPETSNPQPRTDIHANLTPFAADDSLSHSAFVASETIDFLRANGSQPFFAIAGFYAPHPPLLPPQEYLDLYQRGAMRLPYLGDRDEPALADFTAEHWRMLRQYYYAYVSQMDHHAGRILDELQALGLDDNTIVVFTSDHGEHLGDHGRLGKGTPGYDSAARVPLLLRYPGHITAGQTSTAFVEALDIVPTLLEFTRIQQPYVMQGRSLRPVLTGQSKEHRASVYCEHKEPLRRTTRMVCNDSYMYCAVWDRQGQALSDELYDLASDPHQLNNVADQDDYREARMAMRGLLLERILDAENPTPTAKVPY